MAPKIPFMDLDFSGLGLLGFWGVCRGAILRLEIQPACRFQTPIQELTQVYILVRGRRPRSISKAYRNLWPKVRMFETLHKARSNSTLPRGLPPQRNGDRTCVGQVELPELGLQHLGASPDLPGSINPGHARISTVQLWLDTVRKADNAHSICVELGAVLTIGSQVLGGSQVPWDFGTSKPRVKPP